ncbi:hypothetical protein F5882DRAFT_523283 [Hyaloscypha sp. PMI_1271]|nr:hypothetical protein F5882DRAFT_523283 [Hyaloscypha sp. PMI_1271]
MGALGSETSAKQAASFGRTMRSVVQTMQHLSDENNFREQPPWGKDSWKRVVVLVVTDGVVVGDDTLSVLKKMGVYFQRGDFKVIPRDGETEYPVYDDGNSSPLLIKGKLVRARIYEYSSQFTCHVSKLLVNVRPSTIPLQIVFCKQTGYYSTASADEWTAAFNRPQLGPGRVLIQALEIMFQAMELSFLQLLNNYSVETVFLGQRRYSLII